MAQQNSINLSTIKDAAFLANESYKTFDLVKQENKEKPDPITNPATNSSFEVIDQIESANGFSATVFRNINTNEYTIACRGTEFTDLNDFRTNARMVVSSKNNQFEEAKRFTDEQIKAILASDPNAKIIVTGHSLGGSLAQYIAYETGHKAVTFNSFGAKSSIQNTDNFDSQKFEKNSNNVTNIINTSDVVSVISDHYGNNFTLGSFDKIQTLFEIAGTVPSLKILKIPKMYFDHSIETSLSTINQMDEHTFAKHMNKPYDNNAILDDPDVRAIINGFAKGFVFLQDNIYNTVNYYKNATLDSFINDLKYIGEMIYDKASDIINIGLYDPIALDLDGNGKIDTLSLENGVFFDHNGDKVAFKSSWVNSSDGILARDINGDGKITSGAELFGNFTKLKNGELAKNGAQALKDLDDNNDGIFDSNDKAFNEILVWQDKNSDGISQKNELKTLSEHNIKSIDLEFMADNTALDKDNKQILVGSFAINDSDNSLASDIDFSVNSIKISA